MVPEFTPSDALREARRDSDNLVEHLVDAGRDFPVDDGHPRREDVFDFLTDTSGG